MKPLSLIMTSPISHLTADELKAGVDAIDRRMKTLKAQRIELTKERRARGTTPTKGTVR